MAASTPASQPVPPSHRYLFAAPTVGVLTTLMPDGQPHSCLVWTDYDGECARVNTTLERQSGRNLLRDPRLSLLVVDPENTARYVQIRAVAGLIRAGAVDHLDALTRAYTRHPCFYGHVYPMEQRARETRVTVRLRAHRITVDAIHSGPAVTVRGSSAGGESRRPLRIQHGAERPRPRPDGREAEDHDRPR